MEKIVHIANTDVEFEMARPHDLSVRESWERHSLCMQLQYLPLLIADPADLVAVSAYPDEEYLLRLIGTGWYPDGLPRMALLEDRETFHGCRCIPWGASKAVKRWAQEGGAVYQSPDWDTACQVNSKVSSFTFSHLPGAALLYNEDELIRWLEECKGAKVLKSCYGLSGRGNRCIDHEKASAEILAFCNDEWKLSRPVIGEPWVDRFLDFSTQWEITPSGKVKWIGAAKFLTDQQGRYLGTAVGPVEQLFGPFLPFLHRHREKVEEVLDEIVKTGFFGYIGFDALLYKRFADQDVCLYPIVEINGRQTMSLVALRLQKRLFPENVFYLSIEPGKNGFPALLPDHCRMKNGKIARFYKNIKGDI